MQHLDYRAVRGPWQINLPRNIQSVKSVQELMTFGNYIIRVPPPPPSLFYFLILVVVKTARQETFRGLDNFVTVVCMHGEGCMKVHGMEIHGNIWRGNIDDGAMKVV